MSLWNEAYDTMNAIESRYEVDSLPLDRQLQLAEIKALLAIGQELSQIHHEGINPDYSRG